MPKACVCRLTSRNHWPEVTDAALPRLIFVRVGLGGLVVNLIFKIIQDKHSLSQHCEIVYSIDMDES